MHLTVVALSAVLTGLSTLVLTPWACTLAERRSRWLRPWVAGVLGVLGGAGAAALARGYAELLAFAALAVACALLVVVDLASHRLPDAIVGPTYPILFATLAVAAATSGAWGQLGRAAVTAGLAIVGYFALAFIAPANLGLGDVKLSGLLGAFLGWLGWSHTLLGILAGFALGGIACAIALLTARASRRTDLAFGPWMVAGAVLGAVWGPALVG